MKNGKIYVAGIGPGCEDDITPAVKKAVSVSDVVVGYNYYFSFIQPFVMEGAECVDSGMRKEWDRAQMAFGYAEQGKTVCVISSGDAGIYGMAPLVWEMKRERGSEIEIGQGGHGYLLLRPSGLTDITHRGIPCPLLQKDFFQTV